MSSLEPPLTMIEFTRGYLAVFYTFVAAFYTVKVVMAKRKSNSELIFPGKVYCSTWWNHMTFRLFRSLIWMVCLFRFFYPEIDGYLGLIIQAQTFPVILAGNLLLTIGFISTIVIHLYMKDKWRSGIDPQGPSGLITEGIYKYSRNPIFLSVVISQLGFFLALPSVFTLVCLIIGVTTLYRQIQAEENHLSHVFTKQYKEYCANTRRWF